MDCRSRAIAIFASSGLWNSANATPEGRPSRLVTMWIESCTSGVSSSSPAPLKKPTMSSLVAEKGKPRSFSTPVCSAAAAAPLRPPPTTPGAPCGIGGWPPCGVGAPPPAYEAPPYAEAPIDAWCPPMNAPRCAPSRVPAPPPATDASPYGASPYASWLVAASASRADANAPPFVCASRTAAATAW